MIRFGRRSLSDDAQVVRVARERDDMMQTSGGRCAGLMDVAIADRIRRSHLHARSKTYVSAATDRLPVAPRHRRNAEPQRGDARRTMGDVTDSIGTLWPKTRPPRELHRNESAQIAENRKGDEQNIGRRTGSSCPTSTACAGRRMR
jgi:hypothetical protein